MNSNFYSTAAQVLPIILLALLWESGYLEKVHLQRRRPRREDPEHGVLFWTKPRVRVYALTVTTATLACLVACMVVLAGLVPDSVGLRAVIVAGIVLESASLLYRIWNDIWDATAPAGDPASPPADPEGSPPVP